ncbi:MAG: hypothetical protein HY906_16120 [Deltaproteobacteria bacterium]|nr:hypothetical protein [Deltaproteobacteria bacterium]
MKPDPGIEPVREVRKAVSRSVGNDPARLVAYYIELQERFAGRLQHAAGEGATEEEVAAGAASVARDPP